MEFIKYNSDENKKNSLYFDVGANIGMWSLENIKICEKIIALEPSRNTFEVLVENCREKKIICLNYAVSNENKEEIDFYESKNVKQLSTINKNWLCSKESRFYGTEHIKTSCKTISLDRLIEQYGMPDLIKIDVEGAEDLVISSLTQKVKNLCFEWAREFHFVKMILQKSLSQAHQFSHEDLLRMEDLNSLKPRHRQINIYKQKRK